MLPEELRALLSQIPVLTAASSAVTVFKLKTGDHKRMPFRLSQNGAALTWTPDSVILKISPHPCGATKQRAATMTSNSDGYYDWTAADYNDFPADKYDCEILPTKPASVTPSGPETAPTSGRLTILIERAL